MQLFLLLFLLSCVAMVTAVNGCHSDRDKDHRPRQNCTAAGYGDVPPGFEPTTKVLLFPRNLFSSLSWASFQIFTEIYEIDLTGNKVPEVTLTDAPVLPTLSVLRLGSNRLTSLSDGSFSACPALIELYLENNGIDSLSDHTFSGLAKLEILDLSSNRIKVLPELMLHPLPAIETLYLEINKIKVMPDNWFSQKEEVPYLYLSANPWVCSCSLGYFRRYLDDNELNVYVRDGPIIKSNIESVVCDSPQWLKGKPVISLDESDLCTSSTESSPAGDFYHPPVTDSPYQTSAATTAPTTTITPPPPTSSATAAPTPATTEVQPQLHTEHHTVVTWSRFQTFTTFMKWSTDSEALTRVGGSLEGSHALVTHPSLSTVRPPTERPADAMTHHAPADPRTTVPSTVTATMQQLQVVTTPPAPTEATTLPIPPWTTVEVAGRQQLGKISVVGAAGGYCFWLFAACVLLCAVAAACILATLAGLVVWYRGVYKPLGAALARRGGGSEGVRLLTYSRKEEKEATGAGGGVMALYRSVLFIQREGGDEQREDGGKEGEGGGEGGTERLLVSLEPTGSGAKREDEGQRGGREEGGVYRKTLYRLFSKEEEVEGWGGVMEECRVSADDGGRRGGGGEVSRKRYSVILREERAQAGGGREELDWVVGGWEVKRGEGEEGAREEEHRSSWGQWLAHYLPSMPWGVTMPPEGGAAR